MTVLADPITIRLPANALRRLRRVAGIARRPLDDVIAQTLQSTLPPLPEEMPIAVQQELAEMESLSTASLQQQIRSQYNPANLQRYDELLVANASNVLGESERQELARLRAEADKLMFRKAYAALLLKWRGERVQAFTELAAEQ